MVMIKSHKCTPTHEQVIFVKLRRAVYEKFAQVQELGESDFKENK